MSGNNRFVPTRHLNFYRSSGLIIGLLLLCGDIISRPGPTITTRTQFGGSSVPLKGLVTRGATPYIGLYGEAPPERGTFFRLQVYKRVAISQVEVYKRVGRSVVSQREVNK